MLWNLVWNLLWNLLLNLRTDPVEDHRQGFDFGGEFLRETILPVNLQLNPVDVDPDFPSEIVKGALVRVQFGVNLVRNHVDLRLQIKSKVTK